MSADPAWKGVYRAGGVSFIVAAILTIFSLVTNLALVGTTAMTGKALLDLLATKSLFWQLAWGALILSFGFYIPGILAIYLSLKKLSRTFVTVASVTGLVATSLSIAGTMIYYAVSSLSSGYSAATTDAQRTAYIASADLAVGVFSSGILFIGLLFAAEEILTGVVMLRGVFGKGIGYFTIFLGLVSIPGSIPSLFFFVLASLILGVVWFVVVGWKLYKLA